jgi:rfaE bifunctional protein kinase chain/domain
MTPAEILSAIPRLSVLVVGDICLDRWCTYDPAASEASRETGIQRVGVVHSETTAGAGGTVANNLAALGCARVAVLGAIGDDGFGWELSRALTASGVSSELLVRTPSMQTFTYTKVINRETGIEDLPRLDFINTAPLEPAPEHQILDRLRNAVSSFDVILIADQAETVQGGVVTPAVREMLAELASHHAEKIFFADSRRRIQHFRKVTIKPNQEEAATACNSLFGRIDYPGLRRHVEAGLLMVTHGASGALVVEEGGETLVATRPVAHPIDICGAGDSFSAGAALALAAGATAAEAAGFGNLAASITIMKKGTGTASPKEVLAARDALPDGRGSE